MPLFSEIIAGVEALVSKTEFSPTLTTADNRKIMFWVENDSSLFDGRITGFNAATGRLTVIDENQPTRKEINPALIKLSTLRVTKINHATSKTVELFKQAMASNQNVSFVNLFAGPRMEAGRIVEITATSFVISNGTLSNLQSSLSSVDPDSITILPLNPRDFVNSSEAQLWTDLKHASESHKYVGFKISQSQRLFEGRVQAIEIGVNGEYRAIISSDNFHQWTLPISQIVPNTFRFDVKDAPVVRSDVGGGIGAAKIEMLIETKGVFSRTQRHVVSDELVDALELFSDERSYSGQKMPEELVSLIKKNSEARIYFTVGENRIRLTIARDKNDIWSIGETSRDLLSVDESYRGRDKVSRYSLSENHELTWSHERNNGAEACNLRSSLRQIKFAFMQRQGKPLLNVSDWKDILPEEYSSAEFIKILLASIQTKFSLTNGFIRDGAGFVNEQDAKFYAAAVYLRDHQLVYWSYNAEGSNVAEGIYPQSGPGSVNVEGMWLTSTQYETGLISAMEARGLIYENGKWR